MHDVGVATQARAGWVAEEVKYLFVAEQKFYVAYFHAPLQHNATLATTTTTTSRGA